MCLLTLHPAGRESRAAHRVPERTKLQSSADTADADASRRHRASSQRRPPQLPPPHPTAPRKTHTCRQTRISVRADEKGWIGEDGRRAGGRGRVREAQRGAVKATSSGRAWTQMSAAGPPVRRAPDGAGAQDDQNQTDEEEKRAGTQSFSVCDFNICRVYIKHNQFITGKESCISCFAP